MAIAPGPRVISIKLPYAWAILIGRKKFENRSWNTPSRGMVFIHARRSLTRADVAWLRDPFRLRVPDDVQRGAIVAAATSTRVVTRSTAKRFGKWFEGKYGWVFTDVRPLHRPVRTKGKLGLYRPAPALRSAVERQRR